MLLNGRSSAGKSTLAAAFARRQPTPWRVFPVDLLHSIRSRPDLRPQGCPLTPDDWQATFRRTRAGYHRRPLIRRRHLHAVIPQARHSDRSLWTNENCLWKPAPTTERVHCARHEFP
ncbi:phosphotransferase-like protein [Yimella lutea]|uniref:phosphotransferase-like protein n=1 Tax=Yimella lutea TaxID=587872 RepID=UPI0014772E16